MTLPLTRRPRLALRLDGADLAAPLAAALSETVLRQGLGTPAALELVFAEPGSAEGLLPGRAIEAALDGRAVFAGRITQIRQEAGPSGRHLRVVARDAMIRLARRQTLRALADVSAGDVAALLAADLGLESLSLESTPKRALVLQHEQTDLDFLGDLAGQAGLYPVVREGRLLLMSLAGDGEAVGNIRTTCTSTWNIYN